MTIRPHFGVTESNGIAEIGLVDNQAQVRNSLFLLKNAQKIHYSEEVIKAYDALKNSKEHEVRDLKELVAADLKSRSEKQISIVTKFFDFIGSLFFSSFGYETTMDKIKTAFSVIIRKDYEGDQKEEEISKSPKSADRSKVKEEDKPKSKDKDAERQDNPKADDEANELLKKQAQEQADKESQERLAKEESERNAKEKSDKESQERQAKERTEREAKEKADREAQANAEQKAQAQREKELKEDKKTKEVANKEELIKSNDEIKRYARLEFDDETSDELSKPKELKIPSSIEELNASFKDKISVIKEKVPRDKLDQVLKEVSEERHVELDKLHNRMAAARLEKDEKQEQVLLEKKIAERDSRLNEMSIAYLQQNQELIYENLSKGDFAAAISVVRSFPEDVQDKSFNDLAILYFKNNYSLARFFASHIKDDKLKNQCLDTCGLNSIDESIRKSKQSEFGKELARQIANNEYPEAWNSLKNPTFALWILDSAIRHYISIGDGPNAEQFINLITQQDLKTKYNDMYLAAYHLQLIKGAISTFIPRDPNVQTEIINTLRLLKNLNVNEAIQTAITLPTDVLKSVFLPKLADHYISNRQYLEARNLIPLIDSKSYSKQSYLEEIATKQIDEGLQRDAIETLKLIDDDNFKTTLVNTYAPDTELALNIAGTMTNPSIEVAIKISEYAKNDEEPT